MSDPLGESLMNIWTLLGVYKICLVSDLSISHYISNLHIYNILITIIDKDDAVVLSLPHYVDVTEQATEEIMFDFGTSKIIKFQCYYVLLSGLVQ